jgi:ankyrin repeat protein
MNLMRLSILSHLFTSLQWGCYAIIDAAREGNYDCLSLLIETGAIVDTQNTVLPLSLDRLTHNQWGETALMAASSGGHYDCIQLLIKSGATLDLKDQVCSTITSFSLSFHH